jgi:hypothetical protein
MEQNKGVEAAKGFFYPSEYFFAMARVLWRTMLFRHGDYGYAAFLWVMSPLLPVVILGWYLADITSCRRLGRMPKK